MEVLLEPLRVGQARACVTMALIRTLDQVFHWGIAGPLTGNTNFFFGRPLPAAESALPF